MSCAFELTLFTLQSHYWYGVFVCMPMPRWAYMNKTWLKVQNSCHWSCEMS